MPRKRDLDKMIDELVSHRVETALHKRLRDSRKKVVSERKRTVKQAVKLSKTPQLAYSPIIDIDAEPDKSDAGE